MKIIKYSILHGIFCITALSSIQATMVEYKDDAYSAQAPQDIGALAQKAAAIVGFDTAYEVVVPKKPGIEINPLNKFVTYGINPFTKNPFILVNPEWLATMPEEQQLFFFVRGFLVFMEGRPFSMKVIPYLFFLVSFFFGIFLFLLLGKTPLKNQKTWIRILIAIVLAGACELLFLDRLEATVLRYLGNRFDINVLSLAAEKMKNRDAAIKALEFYDASIKKELSHDATFWAPYKDIFGAYAQELKKNS